MRSIPNLITLFMLLVLSLPQIGRADPYGIIVNNGQGSISTVDLGTNPPTIYGPFLQGELGTGSDLLDIAVNPEGDMALVSNFTNNTVYAIDIADPTHPTLMGSIDIGFPAEDIAITPDGRYALVVDGSTQNKMAVIDLDSGELIATYTLQTADATARCVATEGNLVVVCDTGNDRLIYGIFDPDNGLSGEQTIETGDGPVNAAFSPDGRTLVAANRDDTVSVYLVSGSTIQPGATPSVSGLPGRQQSIAFSRDGRRLYVLSVSPDPDTLSFLDVNGPGNLSIGQLQVVDLLSRAIGRYYGVDALSISPDGRYALVGGPSSISNPPAPWALLINLSTWETTELRTSDNDPKYPAGVATFFRFEEEKKPIVTAVPTMTEWGTLIFIFLAGGAAVLSLKKRQVWY